MRDSKQYLFFAILAVAAIFVRFNLLSTGRGETGSFRGAQLEPEVWNPLIASSVNDNPLSVVIDNKEYTNEDYSFYMDDNLNIMLPVSILQTAFNCSAHIYEEDRLLVEKHTSEITFPLDSRLADVNGKAQEVVSPFIKGDDDYYISLNDLSNYLGYSYTWNIQENLASAIDTSESASIPAKYDLRDRGRVTEVRDQGSYGTCWAFASLGALESSLLPEESSYYSADHMTLSNGFNLTQEEGGEYTMSMAYLVSWKGPVYEEDDPYGDGKTDETLDAVKHVQEIQIIDGKDYEKIKEAVFQYGGVQTSIYNGLRSSQAKSPYYNRETDAYCYIGTEKPNHDVVIIGWDDNYPKEIFLSIWRATERLSVKTVGERNLERTECFISPIMIPISERITLCIQVWRRRIITIVFIRVICAAGSGRLATIRTVCTVPTSIPQSRRRKLWRQAFMRPVKTPSMSFMW